jgi:hypothetical protein
MIRHKSMVPPSIILIASNVGSVILAVAAPQRMAKTLHTASESTKSITVTKRAMPTWRTTPKTKMSPIASWTIAQRALSLVMRSERHFGFTDLLIGRL